jgi:tetratricopeptide (TPR) repeat protein
MKRPLLMLVLVAAAVLAPRLAYTQSGCGSYDSEESIKACTAIIEARRVGPKQMARAHYNRAKALAESANKVDEAREDMDRAIELDPGNAAYHAERVSMHGDNDSAKEDDLNEAVRLDPKNADYRQARIGFYIRMDRYDDAFKDVATLLSLEGEKATHVHSRGNLHTLSGNTDEAIKDLTRAVALAEAMKPKRDKLLENIIYGTRGYNYLVKRDYNAALNDFSRAIVNGLDESVIFQMRARVFMAQGQHYLAIDDLTKAIKKKPADTHNYHLSADAYEKVGRHKEALADRTNATYFLSGLKVPK